jgi:multiple sugar transport system ATP-binding protein
MPATVERAGGGGYLLHVGDTVLTVPDEVAARSSRLADYVGQVVVAGVRPEDMEDASLAPFGGSGGPGETRPDASGGAPAGDGRTIECQAELVEPLGSDLMVHLNLDMPSVAGNEHLSELAGEADLDLGSQDGKASLVARFSPRSAVREGETIQVAIDTSRLHFFDANSGLAIRDEVGAPLAGGQEPREEQEPLVAQQEGNL